LKNNNENKVIFLKLMARKTKMEIITNASLIDESSAHAVS
jgi:hypothetical protein